MKNLLVLVVLAATLAGGCKKKETAGAGSGSAAATASGSAAATGSDPATGSAAATGSGAATASAAAPAARADVAAFATVFDPINSKLDHVSRARTACEQRTALVDAAKAIDKATPPAGKDAAAWLADVEELQVAVDETGDPCDNGDIKGIEAKLDAAKAALTKLAQ